MSKKNSSSHKVAQVSSKELQTIPKGIKRYISWLYGKARNIRKVVLYSLLTFLSVLAFFLVFIFVELLDKYKEIETERNEIKKKLTYWEEIVAKQPNSPDIRFQAGLYSYRLGKKQKAYDYIEEALLLDPEFKKAQELKKRIEGE